MAPRVTRTDRSQFSAYIDNSLMATVDRIWHAEQAANGRTKRDVIEMLVELGAARYDSTPHDLRPEQGDLLEAG